MTSFLTSTSPQHGGSLSVEVEDILSQRRDTPYAGFNMLLLEPDGTESSDHHSTAMSPHGSLSFSAESVTNHGGGGILVHRSLSKSERRCGGMSNGVDGRGASEWPKVVHGTQSLQEIVDALPTHSIQDDQSPERDIREKSDDELAESLFHLLE